MKKLFLILLIYSFGTSAAEKVSSQKVQDFVIGTLNNLKATQVDCGNKLKDGKFICNSDRPGSLETQGGWNSTIVPTVVDFDMGHRFLDSNMFVTANVLYPLMLVDVQDTELSLEHAKEEAVDSINIHKRKSGYAFWPQIGGFYGKVNRIGPLNLSPQLIEQQQFLAHFLEKKLNINVIPEEMEWMNYFLDRNDKELGMDVLFNIPNDLDDTSLGIVSNYLYLKKEIAKGKDYSKELSDVLKIGNMFVKYVDTHDMRSPRKYKEWNSECKNELNSSENKKDLFKDIDFLKKCSLDDPREHWKFDAYKDEGSYSGGYLTWAIDEKKDIYSTPEDGVLLTANNSFDCVVAANVLLAVSMTGLKKKAAQKKPYRNTCNAVTNLILDEKDNIRMGHSGKENAPVQEAVWKYCGLFYPAHMLFPYFLSRAVREAKACTDLPEKEQTRFNLAVAKLVSEIAAEQDTVTSKKEKGHWYEPIDGSTALPTSLGVLTLQNFGQKYASIAGISNSKLSSHIDEGMKYILKMKRVKKSQNSFPNYSMPMGTFFGGGTLNEIALWKSSAFATSVAMEAGIKYLDKFHTKEDARQFKISNIKGSEFTLSSEDKEEIKKENALMKFLRAPSEEANFILNLPKKDILARPKVRNIVAEAYAGYSSRGKQSHYLLGVEVMVGEETTGNVQERNLKTAYYLVKLKGEAEISRGSKEDNYEVEAKFLGISADSKLIEMELSFLRLVHQKLENTKDYGGSLLNAQISAPFENVSGSGFTIKPELIAHLIGYTYREVKKQSIMSHHYYDLADLTFAVSVDRGSLWALKVFVGGRLGLSYDSEEGLKLNAFRDAIIGGVEAIFTIDRKTSIHLEYRKSSSDQAARDKDSYRIYLNRKF